jgi:hypothetical protein
MEIITDKMWDDARRNTKSITNKYGFTDRVAKCCEAKEGSFVGGQFIGNCYENVYRCGCGNLFIALNLP